MLFPNMDIAGKAIMATVDHSIKNRDIVAKTMIKADLHQLLDSKQVLVNFAKIMQESTQLYNISIKTFAKNNVTFMNSLSTTMLENYSIDTDVFWLNVVTGISYTKHLASTTALYG